MNVESKTYSCLVLDVDKRLNEIIAVKLQSLGESEIREQSHFFNGRYENIYLNKNIIPELDVVLEKIKQHISNHFSIPMSHIKFGYWLNKMLPGDMTTCHRHDDDDEILSGVYYINVPEKSGNLVFHTADNKIELEPKEGMLVMFSPKLEHEVEQNNSTEVRLSIGFNVGVDAEQN